MAPDYLHLYTGNMMEVQRICADLEAVGIQAVVKDPETSAIRAGFAVPAQTDAVQIFVHRDEIKQAKKLL